MLLNGLVIEYRKEIKNTLEHAKLIISQMNYQNDELEEEIYISSILRMCIKYESFTGEAWRYLHPDSNVAYNHPWRYTRDIAAEFGINIKHEYKVAHDMWEIYNALKHVNHRTRIMVMKVKDYYKLNSIIEIAEYINKVLLRLLNKFER